MPDLSEQFAVRLNHLFDTIRHPDGQPYTNKEIAERAGITAAYLGQLRRGLRGRPTLEVVQRLEKAFGVDDDYLLSEDADTIAGVEDRVAREGRVWGFAARALEIRTPEGLALLEAAVEHVLRMEKAQRNTDDETPKP